VDTPSGQQALLQHEIDVAVIRPSTPVRGLRIQPRRHDEFVIAFPPGHDQLMAICRRAGFRPGIRHLANSIFTQLAMAASGLGVTLVPNVSVRQIQPPAPCRPLTDRADIVELSLVSRDGAYEPLTEHFLRIAAQ